MKTWHFERLFHAMWLLTAVVVQHRALLESAVMRGEPGALWDLGGLLCLVLGLLALGGATSTGARQAERASLLEQAEGTWVLGQKPVARRYLVEGRLLVALSALQAHALLSLASVTWDLLIYPAWRALWRHYHPLTTWDPGDHE